jgi:hypothetical protein
MGRVAYHDVMLVCVCVRVYLMHSGAFVCGPSV